MKAATALSGQVITLCTGLIGLTVTFAKEFKPAANAPLSVPWQLQAAWAALIFALVFALWTQMAVVGSLSRQDGGGAPATAYEANVRLPAFIMVVLFAAGVALVIWAGSGVVR